MDGGAAGQAVRTHGHEIEVEPEPGIEARGLLDRQALVPAIDLHDGHPETRADLLDEAADGAQGAVVGCARGDHLEDLVLRVAECLVALALLDVGNGRADQAPVV